MTKEWEIEPDETERELEPEEAAAAITEAFVTLLSERGREAEAAGDVVPTVTDYFQQHDPPHNFHREAAVQLVTPDPVTEILPADFPLPRLIRFVADPALREAADKAAAYALSVDVKGAEGVQRGDTAIGALRGSLKALEAHFDEPRQLAHQLHRHITSTLTDWGGPAKQALDVVGRRVATETRRLEQEAAERRRRAQEEQDKLTRQYAREEAAAAEQAQAPAAVVEELKRQAETATAPPVTLTTAAPVLANSSTVAIWKARLVGTSGESDPNPTLEEMTPAQRAQVMALVKAIAAGTHPLVGIEVGWAYWNKRAKADKSTLNAPGIEAFEDLGLRGKSSRAKR